MLKQTAFPPLPHKHKKEDIVGLDETRYFASVVLGSNLDAWANQDRWANADGPWLVESNNQGVYKPPSDNTAGGGGFARFVIPRTGIYKITFNAVINTAQRGGIKVTRNGRSVVNNSIATDARFSSGGEGVTLCASFQGSLTANDTINWSWWTDQTAGVPQVQANHFGATNTRVTCRWINV